ncbi:MAG: tetratricopeptide repeat protein [Kofleriaceae bacterium]
MAEADDDLTSEGTNATVREGAGAPSRKDSYLEPGAQIGRYIVEERLGEGGMGIVYAARDPELGRTVAIKLLQARSSGGERHGAWLVREAQALARLSHPNVVAVYDVGTFAGNQVFVAMEHVEGRTLREWARDARPWREVIAVMRGAGAGLAAAHAVGLVHRDFKPDNVLVGRDGRVRVMDFGLARLGTSEDEPAQRDSDLSIETVEAKSPLSASLTIAGELYGTPSYMAPELYAGSPADARTDQFSFGVALYEMLYRKRPYDRRSLAQHPRVTPLVARTPPPSSVPARIQRVVMRAISPDPEARYASMDALLLDLVDDTSSRRTLIALASLVGLVGAAIAIVALRRSDSAPPPCQGIDAALAGAWDPATKAAVRTAFDATKLAYAPTTFASVERTLDAYAKDWTTIATDSCRATRVAKTQTEDILSLRQACLDQRLDELRALTTLLTTANNALVDRADKAVEQLTPLARCSNTAALLAPDRIPPDLVTKLAPIRAAVIRARAAAFAGSADLVAIDQAVADARAFNFDALVAEALLVRGTILFQSGKWDLASTTFADAAWAGVRSKRDDVVGEAALAAAQVTAEGLGKPAEAQIWLGLGTAAITRTSDRRSALQRLEVAGVVAAASGDTKTAIAAHTESLEQAELYFGKNHPQLWRSLNSLAATLAKTHDYNAAIPHYERALTLREQTVGSDHPDVALILSNLGACYDHANQPDKARTTLLRALSIRERAFGKDSPRLIATLNNIADLLRKQRNPEALAIITRAEAIAAKVPGTAHPLYHTVLTTLGEVQQSFDDLASARASIDRALALETESKSPMLATTLTSRADLALAERKWSDAIAYAERAIAALEASGGAQNPELWRPLSKLARAQQELKQPALARKSAERALAIIDAAKIDEPEAVALRSLVP